MAVNYPELFDIIGEILQRINEYRSLYTALDTDLSEIEADMDATGNIRLYDGWYPKFESFKSSIQGWITDLINEVEEILLDHELVTEELGAGSNPSLENILVELWRDMIEQEYYLTNCTCTIGTPSYDTLNVTIGQLKTTDKVDGYNAPVGFGGVVNPRWSEQYTQLCSNSEIFTFECVADSEQDGMVEGQESWEWRSNHPNPGTYSWEDEGFGNGPSIQSAEGNSLLTNGELDDFTNNVPNGWTVQAGTAGTDFEEEDTTPLMRDSNSSSMRFISGTGNSSAIEQEINVDRLRAYQIGVWCYLDNANPSDPTLQLRIQLRDGTQAQDITYVQFTESSLGWRQNWSLLTITAFIDEERTIGDSTVLRISYTGATGNDVYVQNAFVTPIVYHGGFGACIVAGEEKFINGDRITVSASNNNAGVFQTFFRRAFGIQLPVAGTYLISDNKAS